MNKEIVYSEVYSILQLLGNAYINKLPRNLYKLIYTSKNDDYEVKFKSLSEISHTNCSEEAIDIIAALHLNFWNNSENEKLTLKKLFNENHIKNEELKKQKYNPDNIFKDVKSQENIKENNTLLVKNEKDTLFKKIIYFIKKILKYK